MKGEADMKTCHVCGEEVEDKILECPNCGATVVKRTIELSVKPPEAIRKRTNPMGTPVSTGSGLTDLLRGEDDNYVEDELGGGSIPMTLTKTNVDYDYSGKKKINIFGPLFKFLILVALIYGVYYLVTNVILKEDGPSTYEAAFEQYITAVNNKNEDELCVVIPSYITANRKRAQTIFEDLQGAEFDQYEILSVTDLTKDEIIKLEDDIQLKYGKTVNIKEACVLRLRLGGIIKNPAGASINKYAELDMGFIKIHNRWYINTESYDITDYVN